MNDPVELLNSSHKEIEKSEERSKKAFEIEKQVKEVKYRVGKSFLELGALLKEFKDEGYYQDLGYESMTEWLNSHDVSISPGWAWNFISIYEVFIVEHKLSPARVLEADYTKLQQIIPVIRKEQDREKVEEWLDKTINLRRVDLKREIQEFRGESDTDIADATIAHIRVTRLLKWAKILDMYKKTKDQVVLDTLTEEIEGEIKKSTGLLDLTNLKKS